MDLYLCIRWVLLAISTSYSLYIVTSCVTFMNVSVLFVLLYLTFMCWPLCWYTRRGIRHAGARIPVFGSTVFFNTLRKGLWASQDGLIEKYGKNHHIFWGVFPIFSSVDPVLIREVFIKQQHVFSERPGIDSTDEVVQAMLANVSDYNKWKMLRSTISPTLSTGKLRQMMKHMDQCARRMVIHLKSEKNQSIDVKEYAGAYVMDSIAATAFGIELDTLSDRNNAFVRAAKDALDFSLLSPVFLLTIFMPFLYPIITRLSNPVFNKNAVAFFSDIVKQAIDCRKDDSEGKVDFLQLMLKAHENKQPKLTETEMLANCISFFVAGYDTTSISIGFLAYNLACFPHQQDKLIEEIDRVMKDESSISDEAIQEMPFLDWCIHESLRLYPLTYSVDRKAKRNIQIQGINFPKFGSFRVPIYHMHRMPEYYPDPDEFIPERFSPEEKAKRDPMLYMPFGQGPRQCLGMRLAILEIKVAIIHILLKFKIVKAPETEIPLKLANGILLKPENGFWIRIEPRNKE